jgi:DNA-directed RNA polymerase sigma subunit (sigma70/sigma32)
MARKLDYVAGEQRGMTFREIGQRLGLTPTNAEVICRKAVRKLREEFRRRGISPRLFQQYFGGAVAHSQAHAHFRKLRRY